MSAIEKFEAEIRSLSQRMESLAEDRVGRIASIEEKLDLLLAHLKVKNTPERSRKEIESLADRIIMDIQQKKRYAAQNRRK